MSSDARKAPPRPPQVGLAGWTVVVASVLVVLTAFDTVANARSIETRDAVEEFLAGPTGRGLGISVETVLGLLRTTAVVAAACAAASAVLGWFALRRDRRARAALTVVVVPLFVAGLAAGGFGTALVAVGTLMLWLQPARDWFDGVQRVPPQPPRTPPTPPAPPAPPTSAVPPVPPPPAGPPPGWSPPPAPPGEPPSAPPAEAPAGPPADGPRPFEGFGSGAARPLSGPAPAPWATAPTAGPWGAPVPASADPGRRPAAVVWACVLAWVFSALAVLTVTGALVVLAVDPDVLLDPARAQDAATFDAVGASAIVDGAFVLGLVVVAWCLAAAVVAVAAYQGRPWGRTALAVSAAASGGASLVLSVGALPLLLPMVASSVALACLLRPESRAWYAAQRRGPAPSAPRGGMAG